MKYVNSTDTLHTIILILRETIDVVDFSLYNEFRQTTEIITNNIVTNNGISTLTFNYTFKVGDNFQFKLIKNSVIYYRGKIRVI